MAFTGVKKHVRLILNYSWRRATCKKPHQKILFPAKVMNFWKFGLQLNYYTRANFNAWFLIEYNRYIHLDTIHARNSKFVIYLYLPCMMFHKYDVAILKILLFGQKSTYIQLGRQFWANFCPSNAQNTKNFKITTSHMSLIPPLTLI